MFSPWINITGQRGPQQHKRSGSCTQVYAVWGWGRVMIYTNTLITKWCCSPPPPQVSRKIRLEEKKPHTEGIISQGKPAGEAVSFFNYVEHWLKGESKNLCMQQELSSRRMEKPQTPFVTQNYITTEKQEKRLAGSKSDRTDQPMGPNTSIPQDSPAHLLCLWNMRFWQLSGMNQAARSPGGDICCRLLKNIKVSKNEWTAAREKLLGLKLPHVISIHSLGWSLPHGPAYFNWKTLLKAQLILAQRWEMCPYCWAITTHINNRRLRFYLLFFFTLGDVTKAKETNHKSRGFKTDHRSSRKCKTSKACVNARAGKRLVSMV